MKTVMHDTAELVARNRRTGQVVFNGEMQLAGISATVDESDLMGAIGNKRLYRIRTSKLLEITTRSAFADIEYWGMMQGVEVDNAGKAKVTKREMLKVVDSTGTLEVTLSNVDPLITTARVTKKDGEQVELAVTAGVITVTSPDFEKDQTVEVFYQEEVTGSKVKIDSDKYGEVYELELRTISYDPKSSQIYSDIYFIFPEATPSSAFEINLENGTVYTPEMTFSIISTEAGETMAEIIEVPRKP